MGRETKTFRKRVESPPPVSPTMKLFQPISRFFVFERGPCTPLPTLLHRSHSAREVHVTKETLHLVQRSRIACCQGKKKQDASTTMQDSLPNCPWAQVARGWSSENSAHHHDDSKASLQGYHLRGGGDP